MWTSRAATFDSTPPFLNPRHAFGVLWRLQASPHAGRLLGQHTNARKLRFSKLSEQWLCDHTFQPCKDVVCHLGTIELVEELVACLWIEAMRYVLKSGGSVSVQELHDAHRISSHRVAHPRDHM